MPDTQLSVLLDIHTAALKRQVQQSLQEVRGVAVQDHTRGDRGDVLIAEINSTPDTDFQAIQRTMEAGNVEDVFLLSASADQNILLQSLKLGVKEFLLLPLQEEELTAALRKAVARRHQAAAQAAPNAQGRLITVLGSRGGAGTTTVAVNLAAALAEANPERSVLLVDLDTFQGEIPLFLDFQPRYTWRDLTENLSRVDDSFLRNVLYQHPNGLYVLPGPETPANTFLGSGETFIQVLDLLQSTFDFLVLDGGQSLSEPVQQSVHRSDAVLLISQLSLPFLANTKKMLGRLRPLVPQQDTTVQVLINRYHKKINITLAEAEESLKTRIAATLPNDYQFVMSAMNQGKIFSQAGARHKLTKQMQQLAAEFTAPAPRVPERKKKWFAK